MAATRSNPPPAWASFQQEFRAAWERMPDKGLFLGLCAAWLALFHFLGNSTFGYVDTASLFKWLNVAYTMPNSEDGHGQLVPFVVLGLLWWKRQTLLAVPKGVWWPGLALLAGAIGLHVLGYAVQQPRVSLVAFLSGLYILIALVWGRRFAAACLFPYALVVFCVPLGALAEPITIPLRKASTDIAVWVARNLLGIPVIQEGVQILDPKGAYQYEVAMACSGIRSLITLVALTTVYGFISFQAGWKRLLMTGLSLPLAVTGNVLRLVVIVLAAEAFGREAGEFVHNWFGFVTFALAVAAMLGLGYWLREPPSSGAPGLAPQSA